MRTCTSEKNHGIQWTAWTRPNDLKFADDLTLLSPTHQQMLAKTNSLLTASASVGLNTHKRKTKNIIYIMENTNPVILDGETPKSSGVSRIWVTSSMNKGDLKHK
ncbi:unnamed protein product [Schistosoma margrebowiei]|uniref:Uncharacterized protein n=1 Tax=Schistosoma margrebowiei TaxID=48269 RepID=A0A183LSB3_9TREM|nr:unnamed protein product [Schistosoma margrebowiei]